MWQDFITKYPHYNSSNVPESYYFCDNQKDADACADLVVKGIKQASASSQWWYERNEEKPAKNGQLFIITNWEGEAKAIIKITKIEPKPYNEITEEFAQIEGDKSLEYWKKVHWAFYIRERQPYHEKPSEDMIIVCEYFDTVWS